MNRFVTTLKVVCIASFLLPIAGCSGWSSPPPKTFEGGGPIPEFKGDEASTKSTSKNRK